MDTATSAADDTRELFRQHGDAIYRFALSMLRHHQDAEDVVQETFVKLLSHLGGGGDAGNLRAWLFTVAVNAARDRQRRRSRWLPWAAAPEPSIEAFELPDEDGRVKTAREAMRRLSPRDRTLVGLRASGLSYQDIAAATGIRPSSVGRLLARAIDRWARASSQSPGLAVHRRLV